MMGSAGVNVSSMSISQHFEQSARKSFSKSQTHRASRSSASLSTRDAGIKKRRHEPRRRPLTALSDNTTSTLAPNIVTVVIGKQHRIFAAHEEILCASPFFSAVLGGPSGGIPGNIGAGISPPPTGTAYCTSPSEAGDLSPGGGNPSSSLRRIALPDEEPDIFSSVLEYLYKGDYYPRLLHNSRRNAYELEPPVRGRPCPIESTVYHRTTAGDLLKDTVIYCAAERYGLADLKRIALMKQGLQSGIPCSIVLASARFAYSHTPDSDSKLRAHYLALIIRSRTTFKRSGNMQVEMYKGGSTLFFDLFVALSNHIDDVTSAQHSPRSRHS